MSAPNFNEVLSKKYEEVEKPKPRPLGSYLAAIQGVPEQREISSKNGDMIALAFKCKIMAAVQVDDQEALADQGDIMLWPPMSHDVFIHSPEGQWQLRQFLTETLGIEGEGKSLGEMVSESPGKQLLITLKHEPYTSKANTPEIATRIASTAHT